LAATCRLVSAAKKLKSGIHPQLAAARTLDVQLFEKARSCSLPIALVFYKIKGLLPAVKAASGPPDF
jgi:hypothetical protein